MFLAAQGFKHTHTHTRILLPLPAREELFEPVPLGNCGHFSGLQSFPLGEGQECELGRDASFQRWPGLGGLPETPSPRPPMKRFTPV